MFSSTYSSIENSYLFLYWIWKIWSFSLVICQLEFPILLYMLSNLNRVFFIFKYPRAHFWKERDPILSCEWIFLSRRSIFIFIIYDKFMPTSTAIKNIEEKFQFALWKWISKYYFVENIVFRGAKFENLP